MHRFHSNNVQDCLSDLQFDRLRLGELQDEEHVVEECHLAFCARCRRRQAHLNAQVLKVPPFPQRPRPSEPKKSGGKKKRFFEAALAALVTTCMLIALGNTAIDAPRSTRSKGETPLSYFILREGRVLRPENIHTLLPQDRIRFAMNLNEDTNVAILSLDSHGAATIYYSDGAMSAHLAAGREVLAHSSVELDGSLGLEKLYALLCTEPFEVEPLRSELEEFHHLSVPDNCRVDVLQFTKVSRE